MIKRLDAVLSAISMSPETYFYRLPAEYVRDWLPARVENLRWPPMLWHRSWTKVLGDRPEMWRHYRWREGFVDLSQVQWRADVGDTVRGLTDACFRGVSNPWASFASQSLDKIDKIQQYAYKRRALPSRLLIAETEGGLFLVDGYHRVSWFAFTSDSLGAAFPVSPIASCYFGRYEEGRIMGERVDRYPEM